MEAETVAGGVGTAAMVVDGIVALVLAEARLGTDDPAWQVTFIEAEANATVMVALVVVADAVHLPLCQQRGAAPDCQVTFHYYLQLNN